jgi:hypothetical protein
MCKICKSSPRNQNIKLELLLATAAHKSDTFKNLPVFSIFKSKKNWANVLYERVSAHCSSKKMVYARMDKRSFHQVFWPGSITNCNSVGVTSYSQSTDRYSFIIQHIIAILG